MSDFRRYPKGKTRQLVDFNHFLSETGEKLLICVDRGILNIARYLLQSRGSYRTTYYVSNSDAGYILPTESQFDDFLEILAEETEAMTTCNDLADAINNLASSLGSGSSSGGCGCIADPGMPVTDFNDNEPVDLPQGEEFPSNFSDREEYDSYRCKAAYKIIRDYIGTLRNWATLATVTGTLTLAVFIGLALLVLPPIGAALIFAALGLLIGIDVTLLTNLALIAEELEDNIDEIACNIYTAETTEGAATALRQHAQEAVDTVGPTNQATFEIITNNLISNEAMEILFSNDPAVAGLAEEDCSACEQPLFFIDAPVGQPFPTLEDGDMFTQGTIQSAYGTLFGGDRNYILVQSTGEPQDNYFRIDAIIDAGEDPFQLHVYDDTLTQIFNSGNVSLASLVGYESDGCNQFHLMSQAVGVDDPFTVQFSWSETPF